MKDATQINTAIPMVVRRENYADRLTRWMADERRREQDAPSREQNALSGKLAEAVSNALMALALARESKYRWIPVTERLHEEGAKCVVRGYAGGVMGSYHVCATWGRKYGKYSGPSWCVPYADMYFAGDLERGVTHWMPLPPPPK